MQQANTFDLTHTQAVVNWINGKTAAAGTKLGTGNEVGLVAFANFQTVVKAQNAYYLGWANVTGGYQSANYTPTKVLADAFTFVDQQVGRIIDTLQQTGAWNNTLLVLTATYGGAPVNKTSELNVGDPGAIITAVSGGPGTADYTKSVDLLLIWYHNRSVVNASCAYLLAHRADLHASGPQSRVYCGADVAAYIGYTSADFAKYPTWPDILVIPDPGVVYTTSTHFAVVHGGDSVEDRRVPLVVGGGAVSKAGKIGTAVDSRQVAPTVLTYLGLDPSQLQGVVAEGTVVLPGVLVKKNALIISIDGWHQGDLD